MATLIWGHLKTIVAAILQVKIDLTVLEILLGTPCVTYSMFHLISMMVLLTKQYIYSLKVFKQFFCFFLWYYHTSKRIEAELYLVQTKCLKNNDTIMTEACKKVLDYICN